MSLGVYVHVPWCASVCGYCDFNTYVPDRVRGASPANYADTAVAEAALMHAELGGARPETVFFGGGTPTLLEPADLGRVLAALEPAPGAEITIEANPETVDAARLEALREAGFTRVSIGMQSARAHVLAVLDRVHTAGRAGEAARAARAAGFEHVSLDLIYGTPGESDEDWRASLDAALDAGPDHVSTYGLTVEPGTRLSARVRAGAVPAPDEDALARRYAITDATLSAAGLRWYEVSSWASSDAARCRHNRGYWTSGNWWALGPGAHGHMDGTRFWTHRHPAVHARAVAAGELPIAGREVLDAGQRRLERTLLELRMVEGLDLAPFPERARDEARRMSADGLLDVIGERAVLTVRGRCVADGVALALA